MLDFFVRRGVALGSYLLAMGAQVSGAVNTYVAVILAITGTVALFFPASHHTLSWYKAKIAASQGYPKLEIPLYVVIGLIVGWLIFTAALGATLWWRYSGAPVVQSSQADTERITALEKELNEAQQKLASVQQTGGASTPVVEPLPKNATFRSDGKIFWTLKRTYTTDEAKYMLDKLGKLYDVVNKYVAPSIRSIDEFNNQWPISMKARGLKSSQEQLSEIRNRLREEAALGGEILNERPYFRSDLSELLEGNPSGNYLIGALNNYIDAITVVPENADVQLIKRALDEAHRDLLQAQSQDSKWLSNFNTRVTLARDELLYFINRGAP